MKWLLGRSVRTVSFSAMMVAMAGTFPLQAQQRTVEPPAASAAAEHAQALSDAFHSAADSVLPAVVTIKSTSKPRVANRRQVPRGINPFRGTPYEDFFGDEEFFGLPMPEQGGQRREGTGSGVIIKSNGLILTNNHVVQGADEVVVELSDGRSFRATDIRTDRQTDLAILRIEADEPLPAARLGDSDAAEIGDWVLAIGNPFELSASVSAGIISAKGRSLNSATRASFLQTDAAINPGNSGGPLVNLRGEVIGINTAIASSSGGYQGIGFAIPVNLAKWVIDQLVSKGSVSRAYLGIGIRPLMADDFESLGIPRGTQGVLVYQISDSAPAAKAGIQIDDVITEFAGQKVSGPADLQRVVERSPLGSQQTVTLIRDGRQMNVEVTTEALPDDLAEASENPAPREEAEDGLQSELGLSLLDLTRELSERLDLPAGSTGALVGQVSPDGIARQSGLERGMLIVEVAGKPITSVADFEEAMEGVSLERGVRLTVRIPGVGTRGILLKQR